LQVDRERIDRQIFRWPGFLFLLLFLGRRFFLVRIATAVHEIPRCATAAGAQHQQHRHDDDDQLLAAAACRRIHFLISLHFWVRFQKLPLGVKSVPPLCHYRLCLRSKIDRKEGRSPTCSVFPW